MAACTCAWPAPPAPKRILYKKGASDGRVAGRAGARARGLSAFSQNLGKRISIREPHKKKREREGDNGSGGEEEEEEG